MSCKKCPHHVRHGQVAADGKSFEFIDRCGLMMKQQKEVSCDHYPFNRSFDYGTCEHYISVFKVAGTRNDVVPTNDIQYSNNLGGNSITEMELL